MIKELLYLYEILNLLSPEMYQLQIHGFNARLKLNMEVPLYLIMALPEILRKLLNIKENK